MTTTLYSVITVYAPDQVIAEHFPSAQLRRDSLLDRINQLSPPGIPMTARSYISDAQLATLVMSLLAPASVVLTEARLDPTSGVYRPADTNYRVA